MAQFTDVDLKPALRQALEAAEYRTMTPVQAASLPAILAGQDVIAQAKTGSGKTAAFALGLLSRLDAGAVSLQGLVLCPTRELAEQVSREVRRLASCIPNVKVLTLCGGVPVRTHVASLAHEPHIVIGTPGRIVDLITRGALDLSQVGVLVLDEADRMLDMGFNDDITAIAAGVPALRQTLLFSATYADEVRAISADFQRDPVAVSVAAVLSANELQQVFVEVDEWSRFGVLTSLLDEQRPDAAVIFCNTKQSVRELCTQLAESGHSALALHGDLEQRDRDEVLLRFVNHSATLLVATDVAARGLDIEALPLVVNYELAHEPEIHVHRIGRTGRAGRRGLAVSLCLGKDRRRVAAIEEGLREAIEWRKLAATREPIKPLVAPMATLIIDGGRQDKLRAGDLLGALTGSAGVPADAIGKIDIFPQRSYVAIQRRCFETAFKGLASGRIKKRRFRARRLS
jgi:ATP-dependent RNA helicase DbpA